MTDDEVPLSVYRMTGDDLVEEYHYLYSRFDRLTPNQKARFYFVKQEMKARGLGHGLPTPATRERNDAWDGEI
ncbi:hypothetical protein KHP11_29110 [Rhodococcus erythropolis]|uniref:hypothetical protein n=1 Tax=Rhodococcus erythropolis TaxID=1833 RepID=UPI0008A2F1A7|nr:hypothetical protein [Rhodococcus erythropolis]MBT1258518.1 hypothetical protein [Rhodococcus erythropolis]OHF24816.1 hypothetical protein BKP30_27620 [Rhodococcus erythropolis]